MEVTKGEDGLWHVDGKKFTTESQANNYAGIKLTPDTYKILKITYQL